MLKTWIDIPIPNILYARNTVSEEPTIILTGDFFSGIRVIMCYRL